MLQVKRRKKTGSGKSTSRLNPLQLRRLLDQMLASTDLANIARLKRDLERGFYGDRDEWNAMQRHIIRYAGTTKGDISGKEL